MTDIVEKLREYADDDHERGCAGRCYDCSCGYDGKRDPLLKEAADEIERLRAELEQCQQTLYRQIGLTIDASEEATKASSVEIERLQAEIKLLRHPTSTGTNATDYGLRTTRAALKEDGDEK